jgi:hypothetical protein
MVLPDNDGMTYAMTGSMNMSYSSRSFAMRRSIAVRISAIVLMSLAGSAGALTIDALALGAGGWVENVNYWLSNDNSNLDPSEIAALTGLPVADPLYKGEAPDSSTDPVKEAGPYQAYYETTFGDDPSDASWGEIVWTGTDPNYMSRVPIVLDVKDGQHIPAHYLFDLSSVPWDGKDTIELVNFWTEPPQGAISHVGFYGGERVPDGGTTALLLGIAVFAAGTVLRRLR